MKPRFFFLICAALVGTFLVAPGTTSAQSQPLVTFPGNGELTFEDPDATGSNGYTIEWSSDLAEWSSDWPHLSFLQVIDGASTTVEVPMFYRVTRVAEKTTPMPAAVTDADYLNNGDINDLKAALGRRLFWDKILSGNRDISCATCHHTMAGTSDGLSLPIGARGLGLGIMRRAPNTIQERVPRNAPHLWNLGASEFTTMFHDGRLKSNPSHPSGFDSPAGNDLPSGLDNPVAAQAMFPVTSVTEMAGMADDSTVGALAAQGDLVGVWDALADRLRQQPEYVDLFSTVFEDVASAEDLTFVHAANAIAEYEFALGRADESPFDEYLRGDSGALSGKQSRGMQLFYGKANCASCHSGKFQSDQSFHAIAMPQIGPGKGDGPTGHGDHGLARETGDTADLYKFRTPSLRNVALTGPWGHAGAYDSLEAIVRHHLDPAARFSDYDQSQAKLPSQSNLNQYDFIVMDDISENAAIIGANEITPISLNDDEVDDLVAFLHALTDPNSLDLRDFVPTTVPSGLPVAD